ncbi:unnamed protein product [Echinostoma caproni]|uniref:PPM-type phosphatase domain-containing protein n=1 Tax=Echinostoma caproni TaxID=27848 RepID=A0A183A978_9TREM|nr:unnamed protein product [Echinostoma caproni]
MLKNYHPVSDPSFRRVIRSCLSLSPLGVSDCERACMRARVDPCKCEPNADAFVIRARHNSAFLATADGVNWGRESMQAARCAIFAVYEYLEMRLFGPDGARADIRNTRDAAQLLFETFSAAQQRIVSCTTGLTTLCVALILPVDETVSALSPCHSSKSGSLSSSSTSVSTHSGSASEQSPTHGKHEPAKRFALIMVSVGDSQAFLLSKFHGIREVTGWVVPSVSMAQSEGDEPRTKLVPSSPETTKRPWIVGGDDNRSRAGCLSCSPPERDFRDAGGALGPVYKNGNPELHNLICAVTLCDPGDLVILGTDGLTDNFDPVITRIALPESPQLDFVDEQDESDNSRDPYDDPDRVADSESNGSMHERTAIPARSWYTPLALSPPPQVSIWPRPPPPPPPTAQHVNTSPTKQADPQALRSPETNFKLAPDRPVRFVSELSAVATSCGAMASPTDEISARSLNFTNQLELSWAERRRYAGKELERVWHEIDAVTCSSGQGQASSRDLCDALIRHALDTTASKRTILQNPDYARIRVHPSVRHKLNDAASTIPDEEELIAQRQWLSETLKRTPGKLDHATVVVYEVGVYRGDENEVYEETSHGLHVPQKSPVSTKLFEQTKHSNT